MKCCQRQRVPCQQRVSRGFGKSHPPQSLLPLSAGKCFLERGINLAAGAGESFVSCEGTRQRELALCLCWDGMGLSRTALHQSQSQQCHQNRHNHSAGASWQGVSGSAIHILIPCCAPSPPCTATGEARAAILLLPGPWWNIPSVGLSLGEEMRWCCVE